MRILLFLFFLAFSDLVIAQGFNSIQRAERIIDKGGNMSRARSILEDARDDDYGFCGNSYSTAFWNIQYLIARSYQQEGRLDEALQAVDSIQNCAFGGECELSDSLKFKLLIDLYGKESILNELSPYLDSTITRDYLKLNYHISLHLKNLSYDLKLIVNPYLMFRDSSGVVVRDLLDSRGFMRQLGG